MKKSIVVFVVMALVASSLFAAGAAEKTAVQQGMTFSNWSGSEKASVEIFTWMIDTFNQKVGAEDQVVQINWPWGETESQLAIRGRVRSSTISPKSISGCFLHLPKQECLPI